jgi:Tfp pilus assembly protein PilV
MKTQHSTKKSLTVGALRVHSVSKGEQGFTLLETAIALVVMMVAAFAMTSLFTFAISYNSDAADRALALSIAQQRMERLRTVTFTDTALATGTTTEWVTAADRPFSLTTTIGGSTTLKTITIQVTPLGAVKQWATGPVTVIVLRTVPAAGQYLK